VTLRRLILFVAAAVVAASCSSATEGVAATVNGTDILISDVLDLRDTYDEDAVSGDMFRDDLSRLIFQETVAAGLATEYGVEVSESAVQARVDEFNAIIETNGMTRAEALGVEGATEALLWREATAFELRLAGIDEVVGSQDIVADLVENSPDAITEVCVRHILVTTAAEAEDVAERLDGGEDFAAVANEVSLDTGTPGGDLGCSTASRYVPEFAQATILAPVGSLFGPIETDFGFHVLIVDDRSAATAEEIAADPAAFLPQEIIDSLWLDWFNELVADADITVASEVGIWSSEAAAITPPSG
jgi:parvulin-like peptidyl-prolyl isomerase